MIRAQTKLEFAYGLALRMAETINARSPRPRRCWARSGAYAEFTRAAIRRRGSRGLRVWQAACGFLNGGPLAALRAILPTWFPRVGEIITLHRFAQSARHADRKRRFDDPALRAADRSISARRQGHSRTRNARAFSASRGISSAARWRAATSCTSASTSPRRRATSRAISPSPTAAMPTIGRSVDEAAVLACWGRATPVARVVLARRKISVPWQAAIVLALRPRRSAPHQPLVGVDVPRRPRRHDTLGEVRRRLGFDLPTRGAGASIPGLRVAGAGACRLRFPAWSTAPSTACGGRHLRRSAATRTMPYFAVKAALPDAHRRLDGRWRASPTSSPPALRLSTQLGEILAFPPAPLR